MSDRPSTRILTVDPHSPAPEALDEAARVLAGGGLVAFATETVYGLGAVATESEAVARIFEAKGRPSFNPLIVHAADREQAVGCVSDWPDAADRLAGRFWPGPLTLVLPRSERIPDAITAGKPTVGVRCPAGAVARGLIERCGLPVAAPSANRSNRLSPTRAEHVLADLDGRIDLILDSGPTAIGLESTVLDLSVERPRLLRPGPIGVDELEAVLAGCALELPRPGASADRPASPGQLAVHYAPTTPAFRVDAGEPLPSNLSGIAVLRFGSEGPVWRNGTPLRDVPLGSPRASGRQLYEALHQLDVLRPRAIIVVLPPDRPEWLAIRDRLLRATRPIAEMPTVG